MAPLAGDLFDNKPRKGLTFFRGSFQAQEGMNGSKVERISLEIKRSC